MSKKDIKLLYAQVCPQKIGVECDITESGRNGQADINKDGTIEYREFIPACVELILTLQSMMEADEQVIAAHLLMIIIP